MTINGIEYPEARLIKLNSSHPVKGIDCDDEDLNDFFINDSVPSINELLTVTILIENNDETIAFYSLLNDKISKDNASNNQWNKFRNKKFDEGKRFRSYPCVKLARLGVHKKYQSNKIGKFILDAIKQQFVDNNRTGCRFITVDAYNKKRTLDFYTNNGFKFLPTKDDKDSDHTKLMYFDLLTVVNAKNRVSV